MKKGKLLFLFFVTALCLCGGAWAKGDTYLYTRIEDNGQAAASENEAENAAPVESPAVSESGAENASPAERPAASPALPDDFSERANATGAGDLQKAIPQEAKDILGDVSLSNGGLGEEGLSKLGDAFKGQAFKILKSALRQAVKLLVVMLLCTAACAGMSDGSVKDAVTLAGTAAVAVIAVGDAGSLLASASATLETLSDFSKAVLPVMCSAAVGAGAVSSAAAKYAATALFMDLLLTVGTSFVLPLVSIYLAAVLANAALPKDTLGGVSKLLKWVCTTALMLLVLAFTTYLGLTGIITGKTDEFAAKAAKTAISTALPVVGGTLSDAADTLVAGAGMVRNAVGVFGLLSVAAVCLGPVLTIGVRYLVYKGVAAASEALCEKRMAEMIGEIGSAFGLLLGLVGAGGVMLFLSLVSSMKAVTG